MQLTPMLPRQFAAAPVLAGVAAQFLQSSLGAPIQQVRQALLESASAHAVASAGISGGNLVFTNLTQPPAVQPASPTGGSGSSGGSGGGSGSASASGSASNSTDPSSGGLSTGAIAAIAVAAVLGK